MEHFFVDENFYSELSDFAEDLELDEEDIRLLPDDYSVTAEETTLERVFDIDDRLIDSICENLIDWNIERFLEESDNVIEKINKAVKSCIDTEKLNSLMPKMYYPNGKFFKITKTDLLECI